MGQARNEKGLKQAASNRRMITTSDKQQHTQSLLKRSMNRQRTLSEAKFSINLKVNRQMVKQTDKSRSLLKQKVKIVRTPFTNTKTSSTESQLKKKLFEQHRTSQAKRVEGSFRRVEGAPAGDCHLGQGLKAADSRQSCRNLPEHQVDRVVA